MGKHVAEVHAYARREFSVPVGNLFVLADEEGVVEVDWLVEERACAAIDCLVDEVVDAGASLRAEQMADQAVRELNEYFRGERTKFTVPVHLRGTDFQRRVWAALCDIPYGETRSYAQLAEAIGSPRGVRAVGQANRSNPVAVVIPCHRVVGANGAMVGYAGKQVHLKAALLHLEHEHLKVTQSAGAPVS